MKRAEQWLVAAVVSLVGVPASAQVVGDGHPVATAPLGQAEMTREMHRYFRGELEGAATACGLAAGSGYAAGTLLAHATDATRAAAVPLLVVGLGEALIGIGLLVRTGPQVAALEAQLEANPTAFVAEEGARMEKVVDNFTTFRALEAALLVAGAGTAAFGQVGREDRAIGAGLAVASQAGIALAFDALAEARAERYLEAIHAFSGAPQIRVDESGSYFGVTAGARF